MVNDVLAETGRRCAGLATIDQVRSAGRPLAGFSEPMAADERALKTFLYERMYDAPQVRTVRRQAQRILAELFAAYRADPALMPPEWRPAGADPVGDLRAIGDFIAGMTDRYAVRRYAEIAGADRVPPELAALS